MLTLPRRSSRPLALLALIVAVTGAACAGGDGRPTSDSATGSTPDSTPVVADVPPPATPAPAGSAAALDSAGATDTAFTGTTAPTRGGADRAGGATLLAVRTSPPPADPSTDPSTDAVERIVFEFDGDGVPRYEIAYAEPPFTLCGSGQPVSVAGGAALRVRLRVTRAHAESGEEILPTVTERDRKLDQPLLRQLTLTCDFEGEVEWLLGVSAGSRYRVLELPSPARLVVDLTGGKE